MSHKVTLLNAECLQHQLQIASHFTFAVGTMIRHALGLRGITVASQINQNHFAILGQCRRHFAPDHMRVRVTVNHQNRRFVAIASDCYAKRDAVI